MARTATPNRAANDSRFTFGVEIETYIPNSWLHANPSFRIGGYHCGVTNDAAGCPSGWKAERDGSLLWGGRTPMTAVEFVSPVLCGAEGMHQIVKMCDWLNSIGARVNSRCGFHVHVGLANRALPFSMVGDWAAKCVAMASTWDTALYAVTGSRNRRRERWNQGWSAPLTAEQTKRAGDFAKRNRTLGWDQSSASFGLDRYRAINLRPLFTDKRTVEFRVFSGTTSGLKACAFVSWALAFASKALDTKRRRPTASKKNGCSNAVEAVRYFAKFIGWRKLKREPLARGTFDSAPFSGEEMFAELLRLAEKYQSAA